MTCTAPMVLANAALPPFASRTVTRFGIVSLGPKFRFDALGAGVFDGNTVRNEAAVPPVAVTFMTTALADAGMDPPTPVTWRSLVVPATRGPPQLPLSVRESRMRVGTRAW